MAFVHRETAFVGSEAASVGPERRSGTRYPIYTVIPSVSRDLDALRMGVEIPRLRFAPFGMTVILDRLKPIA